MNSLMGLEIQMENRCTPKVFQFRRIIHFIDAWWHCENCFRPTCEKASRTQKTPNKEQTLRAVWNAFAVAEEKWESFSTTLHPVAAPTRVNVFIKLNDCRLFVLWNRHREKVTWKCATWSHNRKSQKSQVKDNFIVQWLKQPTQPPLAFPSEDTWGTPNCLIAHIYFTGTTLGKVGNWTKYF